MSEMVRSHLSKIRKEFDSQVAKGMKERHVPVSLFEKLLSSAEKLQAAEDARRDLENKVKFLGLLGDVQDTMTKNMIIKENETLVPYLEMKMRAEKAESRVKELEEKLGSVLCAYCTFEAKASSGIPVDRSVIVEHTKVCEFHPLRKIESQVLAQALEIKALRKGLKSLDGLCLVADERNCQSCKVKKILSTPSPAVALAEAFEALENAVRRHNLAPGWHGRTEVTQALAAIKRAQEGK